MTPETSMRDAIAQALAKLDSTEAEWVGRNWGAYLPAADAVLDTLMTPTPEMIEAGWLNGTGGKSYDEALADVERVFKSMISKAKEG